MAEKKLVPGGLGWGGVRWGVGGFSLSLRIGLIRSKGAFRCFSCAVRSRQDAACTFLILFCPLNTCQSIKIRKTGHKNIL